MKKAVFILNVMVFVVAMSAELAVTTNSVVPANFHYKPVGAATYALSR